METVQNSEIEKNLIFTKKKSNLNKGTMKNPQNANYP